MMLHMIRSFDILLLLYIQHFHLINNMMDYMTILSHFHKLALHLNTLSFHYYFHQKIRLMMILHSMMAHRIRWFDILLLLYIRHFHLINNMMDYMTTLVHFHKLVLHLNTLSFRLNFRQKNRHLIHHCFHH